MTKLPPEESPTNTTCSAVEPRREGEGGWEGGKEVYYYYSVFITVELHLNFQEVITV